MAVADRLAEEHRAATTGCALVDRSERGKLALTGAEAAEFLHGQVTNDVVGLAAGSGCYAAFLTHKGKMQGDLRILHTGDELWLDTERVALQPLFNTIHRFKLGLAVELHKRTVERCLLSLLGPEARRVAGADDLPEEEHANRPGDVEGVPVLLVATDVGVDLIADAARAEKLAAALRERGAIPISEETAECIRVETGRPRFGRDVGEDTIPQEAGLNERAVSFTKGCYVGQETVARLHYRGRPNRHLRGLRLTEPAASGDPVHLGEREIGRVGTAVVSPVHGPIALALLRREAEPGAEVAVGAEGRPAAVVELPFAAS